MFKTSECIKNDKGFTLVELMVTVLLTAIAVISIYRGYTAFSQSADAQQQVMEMQQNLRIGMTRLAADIRRAGMNEEGVDEAGFLCETTATNATMVQFSMDLSGGDDVGDDDDDGLTDEEDESRIGDGDTLDDGEKIRYSLVASGTTNNLQRGVLKSGAYVTHTLITNVEALDFVYFDDEGTKLTSSVPPAGKCPGLPAGELSLYGTDLTEVDRVEVTLVVRATNEDYRFTDTTSYKNLQDTVIYNAVTDAVGDEKHLRRRVFSMSVQIRNNI